jgi:hypothetical protein
LKGDFSDAQITSKTIRALPSRYKDFINYWTFFSGNTLTTPTLKEFQGQLLVFEARNVKFSLDKLDKKNHFDSKNPADKKHRTKCPGCGKTGIHTEDQCWETYPKLKPVKFKKDDRKSDKPYNKQANVVDATAANKPAKVECKLATFDREDFLQLCNTAFEAHFDFEFQLRMAIDVLLPDGDDEDIVNEDQSNNLYVVNSDSQLPCHDLRGAFVNAAVTKEPSQSIYPLGHTVFSINQAHVPSTTGPFTTTTVD